MLYLLVRILTSKPCKYYMASNITTSESVYNILLSLLFHRFISQVKVSAFLNFRKIFSKMFPKMSYSNIFLRYEIFLRSS